MKLRLKIQLFSSIFIFILILLINTAIYFMFAKISTTSELQKLVEDTNAMVETIQANPNIENNDLLKASLRSNGMIRIYEMDKTEPKLVVTKESDYQTLSGGFSNSESHSIIKQSSGLNVAVVSKPIIWDDGQIVTLENSEFLFGLQGTMKTLFYVLVIASLLMLLPTIIGGALLSNFLLRPIQLLTATMKENMQQENWKTIHIKNQTNDELYEMEKTFNEMIDQLKATFKKQEVFVSDASHELKTPIAIVKSYAELLDRQGRGNEEIVDEVVEAVGSEADRMQKLVEQLLQLAKNKTDNTFIELDIVKLCRKVITVFHRAYDRKIEINTNTTMPLFVYGIKEQLEQVLYILIDNALKYSEEKVTVDVITQVSQIQIKVIDHGLGIAKENQAHIFDRFYRVDEARSRNTGGTGLGLAIARTIIEAHHGTIAIQSDLGTGTEIVVRLPLKINHSLSEF